MGESEEEKSAELKNLDIEPRIPSQGIRQDDAVFAF
jgi:hypothetical protein